MQVLLYYRIYPKDRTIFKAIVSASILQVSKLHPVDLVRPIGCTNLVSLWFVYWITQSHNYHPRALDLLHTSMAAAANWSYLIDNFGNDAISDHITWYVYTCAL